MKRIDIGGLTYRVTNKSADTYERTDTHRTRFYLAATKQKSIRQLAQNLVKSNVPCAIFQKLGKCHGRERGRCPKVHDIRNVAICQKLTHAHTLAWDKFAYMFVSVFFCFQISEGIVRGGKMSFVA